MADINSDATARRPVRSAGAPGEAAGETSGKRVDEAAIGLVETLFFAYRDFTGEADAVLEAYGFGRAHHRVLHFVNRRPGLRVADLLDILRITKQSLARVLKQLVDRSFIEQAAGDSDRRERHLYPTAKGKALAQRLARLQIAQVGRALAAAGSGNEPAIQAFLTSLIADGRGAADARATPTAETASGGGQERRATAPRRSDREHGSKDLP